MSGFKMYIIAAVLIMVPAAVSAHEDYDGFREKYSELMRHEDFEGALECAKLFCEESSGTENELLALRCVGQSAMAVDEYDTARVYLQKAMKLWSETDSLDRTADDYAGIITVYNAMGIYSINLDMDYRKAVEYFLAGLRYAQGHLCLWTEIRGRLYTRVRSRQISIVLRPACPKKGETALLLRRNIMIRRWKRPSL